MRWVLFKGLGFVVRGFRFQGYRVVAKKKRWPLALHRDHRICSIGAFRRSRGFTGFHVETMEPLV